MMQAFGQKTPDQVEVPKADVLLTSARLVLEEAMEYVEACGFKLTLPPGHDTEIKFHDLEFAQVHEPDFVEMVDALADTSVVVHWSVNACGIKEEVWGSVLQEVDDNNIMKAETGHINPETGKFEKAPGHPKPNIRRFL